MFLIGTASLSFCSGYGSAHLHKITRQNIRRHCSCDIYVENTLERGNILEIVFTRAAPAFDNLFMGCVFNINTLHKTVEKLTFQAFY